MSRRSHLLPPCPARALAASALALLLNAPLHAAGSSHAAAAAQTEAPGRDEKQARIWFDMLDANRDGRLQWKEVRFVPWNSTPPTPTATAPSRQTKSALWPNAAWPSAAPAKPGKHSKKPKTAPRPERTCRTRPNDAGHLAAWFQMKIFLECESAAPNWRAACGV
mgnify:CR=1 FL=1